MRNDKIRELLKQKDDYERSLRHILNTEEQPYISAVGHLKATALQALEKYGAVKK